MTLPVADTGQTLAAYTQALESGTLSADHFTEDAVIIFEDSGRQVRGQAAVAAEIADLLHGAFAGRMTITAQIIAAVAKWCGRIFGYTGALITSLQNLTTLM